MWSSIRACTVLETDNERIETSDIYNFSEDGNMFFPIGQPIKLIHRKTGEEVATVLIREFTNIPWQTIGMYEVCNNATIQKVALFGVDIKFNRALQIDPPNDIEVDNTYKFEKDSNRSFPLNETITLIDKKRKAIAEVLIISYTNTRDRTIGIYEVKNIYEGTEKEVLTQYRKKDK